MTQILSILGHRLSMVFLTIMMVLGIVPLRAGAVTCPCSLWSSSTTPTVITENDNAAVELGVRFKSSTTGYILGVRFYKGSQNTGTHTGSLWTTTGTRLATATFTGETASGWQQVNFATPVAISANTNYVASYFAPVGRYSVNSNYFASSVTNSPLTAPASTSKDPNGIYKYGGGFPGNTFQKSNYWVDVVYSQTAADTTPPTVANVSPTNGANNVGVGSTITATFNEALDATTVNASTFELRDSSNSLVPANVSYDNSSRTASLAPSSTLAQGSAYTATLKGGNTDPRVKDAAGNALAANYNWSFTTMVAPTNTGASILVVSSSDQPFSKYYEEILRAEGLNSFASADVSTLTPTTLNQYDVVVVGDISLTANQVTLLSDWVNAGGNLIAMSPDKQLASLLGITDQSATLSNAYLSIDTSVAPGAGLVNQTIQFHGSADRYTANAGTNTVATLYTNATTATSNPAVTLRNVGSGKAGAFTYDLARSVVYTHQGNPAWAGQERDGSSPIRPNDLFYGNKADDPQPDYVDLNKVAIPQADEQQRLLSNMIENMNQTKKPLPKFWYFPKGSKAVVVMAGDDHATAGGTKNTFEMLKSASPAGCSVANWECLRATSWLYTNSGLTNAEAGAYNAQGFDMGVHVNTNCSNWTPQSLANTYTNDLADFRAKYNSLPNQTGHRVHCIAWSDWATQPKVELQNGMRMDLNYYYWPNSWIQNRPGMFTGSGLPMRFADLDGTMIDVYQVPSHLVNENGETYPQGILTMLDHALGTDGYYGAFGTHYDYTDSFAQQLMQSAVSRGVPVVTVKQMLDWTDARNASSFTNIALNNGTLTFTATVNSGTGSMMRGMLPITAPQGNLQTISKDGANVSYSTETIKGITYALFNATSGNYTASYSADTTPPTIIGTTPTNNATNVDRTANVTGTFSEALDPSSVNTSSVELRDASNALVPANVNNNGSTVTIDPSSSLAIGANYSVTLKGGGADPRIKDAAGNALAANYSWSFTTSGATLWSTNTTPAQTAVTDSTAVELGVKFTSDTSGNITGVRFYKGATNTGTHTVSLWASNGTNLGTATAINETEGGWQTATFATPIPISANTTYVASYFAPTGHYAFNGNYFSVPYDNAPLHAPVSGGPAGGNGVYTYGGGFPTSSFNAGNYWVDPIFAP